MWRIGSRCSTITTAAVTSRSASVVTTALRFQTPTTPRKPSEPSQSTTNLTDEESLLSLFTKEKDYEVDYTPKAGTAQSNSIDEGTHFAIGSPEEEAELKERMRKASTSRRRRSAAPAVLMEVDRNRYAQLIYHEHYHVQTGEFLARGRKVDEQGWQSAAMEIQWLEEWALTKAVQESIDALIGAGNGADVAQEHVMGSVWACSSFRSYKELMDIAGEEERAELEASAPPKPDIDELDCFREVYDRTTSILRKAVLERVDLHKPLSYILGSQPFYGTVITCTPPLLIPRSETETWVHWLDSLYLKKHLKQGADLRVLDMCCGTGCIGVSLVKNHPKTCKVTAVDFLDEAVQASLANATQNGIRCGGPDRQYTAIRGDMFNALGKRDEDSSSPSFDIIVSNPPYIYDREYDELDQSVKKWETKVALVGDPDREKSQWTYFRDLCHEGHKWASNPQDRFARTGIQGSAPSIVIEVGSQAEMVAGMFEYSGLWSDVQLHLDLKGAPRWVTAVWQTPQPPTLPGKDAPSGIRAYFTSLWKK